MRWNLSQSYLSLPDVFYTLQPPTPVLASRWGVFNDALARDLGLEEASASDLTVLAGNALPPGARPFAQAYAGHQYAHFTMLGDGRALMLGEHRTPDGRLVDLQWKGSGPTPYSRNGDGRAALGPMLREYLMGEAFHALGIPTTRALAVVETGELVHRERELPGAVLTRVAASHLRVGTFEFAAALQNKASLVALVDYALARHYPAARGDNAAAALLGAVIAAQARLVAQWMAVGFVHGVLNTDNVAISGQSLDFGPCAFLDAYGSAQVFSSIDRRGRYSYGNQPGIVQWNLTRLAEALLPVLADDAGQALEAAQTLVNTFAGQYRAHYDRFLADKLGLASVEGSQELVVELLSWMEATGADYTATFRTLTDSQDLPGAPESWLRAWKSRLAVEGFDAARSRMAVNPVYIPRNHRVQAALEAAEGGDYGPFHSLLEVLRSPFTARVGWESYALAPDDDEAREPFVTYCGT